MIYSNYIFHLYLAERAHAEFGRALRRARLNRLVSTLNRRSTRLLSFGQVQEATPLRGQIYLGMRAVPLRQIVGSVGRYCDFDCHFNPANSNTRERWERLYTAALAGDELPPIEVYLLDGEYYVLDGNHRVSVAKYSGAEFIEAVVVEFLADRTLLPECPARTACTSPTLDGKHALPVL